MKNPFKTLRAWVRHEEYTPLHEESAVLDRLSNLESRVARLER